MKKIIFPALGLILSLSLFMTGCGAGTAPEESVTPPANEDVAAPSQEQDSTLKITQEKNVTKDKFLENPVYAEFLSNAEAGFIVPALKQHFIPQGISADLKNGIAYISNYAAAPSIPPVINGVNLSDGTLKAEYRILNPDGSPFASHMGGIAVTGGKIYVSDVKDEHGNARIAEISLANLPDDGGHDVMIERQIAVPVQPSFINYSQGMLWIGNFYHPEGDYELPKEIGKTVETDSGEYGCYILGYELNEDGALSEADGEKFPKAKLVIVAPNKIQGMTCTEDSIYLSKSYGRKADSAIYKYSLNLNEECDQTLEICGQELPAYILDSKRLVSETTLMPMSEGICLSEDGNILILFESGAEKYKDGRDRTDTVWEYKTSEN